MAWSEPLQFLVDGDPVGKGRPRAALVGKRVRMYTPAKTTRYEARVRRAIPADAPPVVGMCRVTVDIVYRRPGRRPSHIPRPMWDAGLAYHVGKQDVDNVVKAVLDGLQMKHPSSGARWLDDDRWVVELSARKRCGKSPHVIVGVQYWVDDVDGA
jgi:Holliday junction resolvase RusA-like endonuclease